MVTEQNHSAPFGICAGKQDTCLRNGEGDALFAFRLVEQFNAFSGVVEADAEPSSGTKRRPQNLDREIRGGCGLAEGNLMIAEPLDLGCCHAANCRCRAPRPDEFNKTIDHRLIPLQGANSTITGGEPFREILLDGTSVERLTDGSFHHPAHCVLDHRARQLPCPSGLRGVFPLVGDQLRGLTLSLFGGAGYDAAIVIAELRHPERRAGFLVNGSH